jgi:hypothetical protein
MRVPRRSRPLAIVLIVLTTLGSFGSWHAPDDPDCDVAIVLHDHAAHHPRLATPVAAGDSEHCALCHWLQTFRIDSVRHVRVPFTPDTYARFTASLHPSPASAAIIGIAPRAPPRV